MPEEIATTITYRMNYLKLAFIISAIALFALACANASNTADKISNTAPTTKQNVTANLATANANANTAPADELAHTRELYGERCLKCHGANAAGGWVEFDNIKLKVPGLREGRVRSHTDQQLARRVSKGGEGMPAFKDKLTPEEIDALVRLIRRDFQGQSAAAANAPVTPNSR